MADLARYMCIAATGSFATAAQRRCKMAVSRLVDGRILY
jgi:hypothetical protein